MPDQILTRKHAVEYLNLDEKTFDNYFQNADEFKSLPRIRKNEHFKFYKKDLDDWLIGYKYRTVELNLDDYSLCLDFALAQHFRGYVLADWGTARQREFGQKITNWVKGQLAELAVKKFFKNEFNADIELDFEIHDQIVPQDIISVIKNGSPRKPKIGIGIKSSKPKSAYLVLGSNEVSRIDRKSDVYIFCRPDIPDDHLLRITKDRITELVKFQQHYPKYKDKMPDFENIPCELAGWCRLNELEEVNKIPGQDFESTRYVKKSGLLHKDNESWRQLISEL